MSNSTQHASQEKGSSVLGTDAQGASGGVEEGRFCEEFAPEANQTMERILVCCFLYFLLLTSEPFTACQPDGFIQGFENVALYKPCNMSSKLETFDNCNRAVNGHKAGNYTSSGDCIHTKSADFNWWEVYLGRPYPIYYIHFSSQENLYVRFLSRAVVRVDGTVCYSFGEVDPRDAENFISCTDGPINGSVVRVEKRNNFSDTDKALAFCEIRIYSCKDGYWGPYCNRLCEGQCENNAPCDKVTGFCEECQDIGKDPKTGCQEACTNHTYGANCATVCGKGCVDDCQSNTGHCTCNPGYQPPLCQEAAKQVESEGLVLPVVGSVVGVVILISVSVVTVICLRRKGGETPSVTRQEETDAVGFQNLGGNTTCTRASTSGCPPAQNNEDLYEVVQDEETSRRIHSHQHSNDDAKSEIYDDLNDNYDQPHPYGNDDAGNTPYTQLTSSVATN